MAATFRPETTQPRFDLRDQEAETINNVGGNQNIFLPGKSLVLPSGASEALTPAERVAAAVVQALQRLGELLGPAGHTLLALLSAL